VDERDEQALLEATFDIRRDVAVVVGLLTGGR
jgi:hypothetical protein